MGNFPKDATKDVPPEEFVDESPAMPCFGRIMEHRWCARVPQEIERLYADPVPKD